jgi:hypothetical protein
MSMQVLVLLMVIVGAASAMWFAKRQPSRQQTVAAVAASVASIYIMAAPTFRGTAWFSMAAVIGTIAVVFLLSTWLRQRRTPPQVG